VHTFELEGLRGAHANQAKALEEQLAQIRRRLEELEKETKEKE